MSRKESIIKRINIDLDNEIRKKQLDFSIKNKKSISYLETSKKIADLIAKIDFDDKIEL